MDASYCGVLFESLRSIRKRLIFNPTSLRIPLRTRGEGEGKRVDDVVEAVTAAVIKNNMVYSHNNNIMMMYDVLFKSVPVATSNSERYFESAFY